MINLGKLDQSAEIVCAPAAIIGRIIHPGFYERFWIITHEFDKPRSRVDDGLTLSVSTACYHNEKFTTKWVEESEACGFARRQTRSL